MHFFFLFFFFKTVSSSILFRTRSCQNGEKWSPKLFNPPSEQYPKKSFLFFLLFFPLFRSRKGVLLQKTAICPAKQDPFVLPVGALNYPPTRSKFPTKLFEQRNSYSSTIEGGLAMCRYYTKRSYWGVRAWLISGRYARQMTSYHVEQRRQLITWTLGGFLIKSCIGECVSGKGYVLVIGNAEL